MALNLKTIASVDLFAGSETILRVSQDGRILITFHKAESFLGIYQIFPQKVVSHKVYISECSCVLDHLESLPFYEQTYFDRLINNPILITHNKVSLRIIIPSEGCIYELKTVLPLSSDSEFSHYCKQTRTTIYDSMIHPKTNSLVVFSLDSTDGQNISDFLTVQSMATKSQFKLFGLIYEGEVNFYFISVDREKEQIDFLRIKGNAREKSRKSIQMAGDVIEALDYNQTHGILVKTEQTQLFLSFDLQIKSITDQTNLLDQGYSILGFSKTPGMLHLKNNNQKNKTYCIVNMRSLPSQIILSSEKIFYTQKYAPETTNFMGEIGDERQLKYLASQSSIMSLQFDGDPQIIREYYPNTDYGNFENLSSSQKSFKYQNRLIQLKQDAGSLVVSQLEIDLTIGQIVAASMGTFIAIVIITACIILFYVYRSCRQQLVSGRQHYRETKVTQEVTHHDDSYFGRTKTLNNQSLGNFKETKETFCSICLQNGCNGTLPCKHSFHTQCINSWLERSSFCPNCKRSYTKKDVKL